jgi:hypothetical protein
MDQVAAFQDVDDVKELLLKLERDAFMGLLLLNGDNGDRFQMSWVFGAPFAIQSDIDEGEAALRKLLRSRANYVYSLSTQQPLPSEANLQGAMGELIDALADVVPDTWGVRPYPNGDPGEPEGAQQVSSTTSDAGLPVWPDLVPLPLSPDEDEVLRRMDAEAALTASVQLELTEFNGRMGTGAASDIPAWGGAPMENQGGGMWDEAALIGAEEIESKSEVPAWEPLMPIAEEYEAPSELRSQEYEPPAPQEPLPAREAAGDGLLRATAGLVEFLRTGKEAAWWTGLSNYFIRSDDLIASLKRDEFNGYIRVQLPETEGRLFFFSGRPTVWMLDGLVWLVSNGSKMLEAMGGDLCSLDVVATDLDEKAFFEHLALSMTLIFDEVPTQALKWDGILSYVESVNMPGLIVMHDQNDSAWFYLQPGFEPVMYGALVTDSWFRDKEAWAALYVAAPEGTVVVPESASEAETALD